MVFVISQPDSFKMFQSLFQLARRACEIMFRSNCCDEDTSCDGPATMQLLGNSINSSMRQIVRNS